MITANTVVHSCHDLLKSIVTPRVISSSLLRAYRAFYEVSVEREFQEIKETIYQCLCLCSVV